MTRRVPRVSPREARRALESCSSENPEEGNATAKFIAPRADSVIWVRDGIRVLRLFTVAARAGEREQAALVVDRLAARRRVTGDGPEWSVLYECRDTSEAMRRCAAELTEIDPAWIEVLDFEVLPSPQGRGARST
jgi:hypothetical protein